MKTHTEKPAPTLGRRIKLLRKAKPGLTQRKLADAVGVTEGMVVKWEGDKATPQPDKKIALARVFGVAPAEMDYDLPIDFAPEAPAWFTTHIVKLEAKLDSRPAAEGDGKQPEWAVRLEAKIDQLITYAKTQAGE